MNKIVAILVLSFAALCYAQLNLDMLKGDCTKWLNHLRQKCNSTTVVAEKIKFMKKVVACAKFAESTPKWVEGVFKECAKDEKISCDEAKIMGCGLGKMTNKQQDEVIAWFKGHGKEMGSVCKSALACLEK